MRISDWSSDVCSSDLDDNPPGGEGATGFWEIDLEGCVETTQYYLRNTPILVTRHADASGDAIEVIDFCPRFSRHGRTYRPVAFARIVRPVSGSPRICVRLRPVRNWGRGAVERRSEERRVGEEGVRTGRSR